MKKQDKTIKLFKANGKANKKMATALELKTGKKTGLRICFDNKNSIVINAFDEKQKPVLKAEQLDNGDYVLSTEVSNDSATTKIKKRSNESSKQQLELCVQNAHKDKALIPNKQAFKIWLKAAQQVCEAQVTIRLVGKKEGLKLNKRYRGRNYATNVLSFIYHDADLFAQEAVPLMGDLVLCVPIVVAEAQQQNKSIESHFAHLTVHGMLHLQGYDHESEDEAEQMEQLEKQIMALLGYLNPYQEEE